MMTRVPHLPFSEHQVHDLIGKIYAAATDPPAWSDFLAALARLGGGPCAALTYHSKGKGAHLLLAQYGVAPEFQQAYRSHFGALDAWYRAATRVAKVGWTGTGAMLVSDRDLLRSEFYNDHLRLNQDLFHFCGSILEMDGSAIGSLSFLRTRRAQPFGVAHTRLLDVLRPHVQRAVQVHIKIVDLQCQRDMLESALDRMTTPIVLVDAAGRILKTNRSADALLRRSDGLISGRDGLQATIAYESIRLRKLIRGAALTGNGDGFSSGGTMQIKRAAPHAPLTLLIAPASAVPEGPVQRRPAACIFITDPELRVETNGEILRRLYGLTPAECALASLLAQGDPLQRAADQRHVTIATARSQLKSIFRKLNVASQSQLVRLLLLSSQAQQDHRASESGSSPPSGG